MPKLNIGDKVVLNRKVDYPAIKIYTIEKIEDGKFYVSDYHSGLNAEDLIKVPDDCNDEYYTSKCEPILWGRVAFIAFMLFVLSYFLTTNIDFIKSAFQSEKHEIATFIKILFSLLAINVTILFFWKNMEKGKGLKNIFIVLFDPIFLLILSAIVIVILSVT